MPQMALVVDDSMLIRHTVCRFLEERGFEVETATNGVDALQVLARIQPNLVVTDMNMPRMNGSELITALKANPITATIPIIILCGHNSARESQAETRAQCAIYKDIDIVEQLDTALGIALPGAPAASS